MAILCEIPGRAHADDAGAQDQYAQGGRTDG